MSEINRKELRQLIKGRKFDNIYLIYGEEKMYVKADTDYLVTTLMGKEPPEFNYHTFTKDHNLDDIAVAIQVVPFVSEYNCVKVSDFDINAASKAEVEQLFDILDNVPDTTVLVLTLPTLEQDAKKLGANFNKLLTYVKKNGTACAMNRETDISLSNQIIRWADKRGIKIERADAYMLQEYVGLDLNTIKNELDKLCNYVGDNGVITGEHIELLVSKRLEANIFQLTDRIVECKSTEAFNILNALFYQKATPDEIVSIISMSYLDFYRVRVAAECDIPLTQVAQDFGYGRREFVLKKAGSKIRRISTPALRESISEITDTIAKLHSVSTDKRVLVELLVAKLLMLAEKREE